MEKIIVLVGTMTGNAEMAAEAMATILREEFGFGVELLLMDDLDAGVFSKGDLFLVCTSTYGEGDTPDTAAAFYQDLQSSRPLAHVRFGVLGLGDSTYRSTYSFGGKRFEEGSTLKGSARHGCESGRSRCGNSSRVACATADPFRFMHYIA
jgi:MioC protein